MEAAASLLSGCEPLKRPGGAALGEPRLYFLQLLFPCLCVKEVESAGLFFMIWSEALSPPACVCLLPMSPLLPLAILSCLLSPFPPVSVWPAHSLLCFHCCHWSVFVSWSESGPRDGKNRREGNREKWKGGSQVLSLLLHNGPGSRPLH